MANGFFSPQPAFNEPTLEYKPGSPEVIAVKAELEAMRSTVIDAPMYIGGKEIRTDNKISMHPPHDHKHLLGHFNFGTKQHVTDAIDAALAAKDSWVNLAWEERASIFLKAADLVAGKYRAKINAATMLCQSKNCFQAEIDAACELADFFRYNVQYMQEIYSNQPESGDGVWNRLEYRPLEGFVFALTPFNFTAIATNLPTVAAMMGNTVVWKPSDDQIYSCQVAVQILKEAGLPDGVINLVYVDGPDCGEVIFSHRDFAGIHFTGSTDVFQTIWETIAKNIRNYRTYPKISGETGGKDFILVHKSADVNIATTALIRGSFEFQGQKCSACSRAYVPQSLWPAIKEKLVREVNSIKMGPVEDFTNYVKAVINERSFDKLAGYIDRAKEASDAEVIAGGTYDKSEGYFIHPTVIVTTNPQYDTMVTELFGPVLTIFIYEDDKYEETLKLVDETSIYALTGSIIAQDRYAIDEASEALKNCAGNFYINDKCTGAVVGQQPFGGGRASGTNDKAGSYLNLIRWVSPRTIKENFSPEKNYRYPFLED